MEGSNSSPNPMTAPKNQHTGNNTPSSSLSNLFQDASATNPLYSLFPSPLSTFSLPSALPNSVMPSPLSLSQSYIPIVPKLEPRIAPQQITDYSSQRPVPQLKLPDKILNKKIKNERQLQQSLKRKWNINQVEETFKNSQSQLILRSRKEKETDVLPERLYSSIKYELNCELKNVPSNLKFLYVKLTCVDGNSKDEILKQNKTPIISGITETGISSSVVDSKNFFTTCLKLQFNDVSYHHNKKNFAFKVSYFLNDDLKKPVLTLISPNFLVLARKPNQQTTKKRKRDGQTEDEEEQENEEKEILTALKEFNTKFSEVQEKIMKLDSVKRKEYMQCLMKHLENFEK
eukprot:gene7330-11649_t